MKKRIFINMHYMEVGGAERALLGFLNAIDTELVDVDLFLNQHTGEFLNKIPAKINLLKEIPEYSAIERPLSWALKNRLFRMTYAKIRANLKYRKYLNSLSEAERAQDGSASHFWFDEITRLLPSLHFLGEYDLAVSFLDPPHIVQDKVLAKKTIEWIHTDFSAIHIAKSRVLPRWEANDYVASISSDITNTFLKVFPSLKNKIVEIENILSPAVIREEAQEFDASKEMNLQESALTLLSIGRYSWPKNFENIPVICKQVIRHTGIKNLRWYIIGYGDDHLIRQNIIEAGVESNVILLGKKNNPYPYIKACDIYVQPSRYEGKCVAVREAQILCKPVVITNYATSSSQVENGLDGIITPLDNEGCAKELSEFIANGKLRTQISDYLSCHDYGNESEISKIYDLLN